MTTETQGPAQGKFQFELINRAGHRVGAGWVVANSEQAALTYAERCLAGPNSIRIATNARAKHHQLAV